jgi:MFS family permease
MSAASLWRHRDFMRLWWADVVSQLGSNVTVIALPLVAILVLDATPFEVGVLGACEFAPFLLVGLPAGAWVDRLRRRPVMIAADLGRAAALASVPAAHWLGALTIVQLFLVAFAAGVLTVFFDVAYQSYLPSLVGRDRLVDGNAKLEIARSAGFIAGPAAGGGLVQALGAPIAVLSDAASFLASGALIAAIRRREHAPARPEGSSPSLRHEVAEGLRYVLGHRLLRPILCSTALFNAAFAVFGAVWLLYATRVLDLSPGAIGAIMAAGTLSIPVAAVTAAPLGRRLGPGRLIAGATIVDAAGAFFVPAAPTSSAVPFLVCGFLLVSYGGVVYNVTQLSLRQTITPDRLLGRMNATIRFVVYGVMPLGSLTGGALGSLIGLRPALWVAALGALAAMLPVLLSPVRGLAEMPRGAPVAA